MATDKNFKVKDGGIEGKDGSQSGPTYTFSSDTNTGMYLRSADHISWSTGGNRRLSLSSSALEFNGVNIHNIDGSASTPSYTFDADTDTGMFRLTGNVLGFSVGGSAAMYMQSSKVEANKVFEILAGSAAAPSLAMKDDSNTGIYKPGADQIGFSTAGTSRMTIAADGTVDVVGTLDTNNLTIAGAQGSDGQVLTSTGSGVAWEAAGGGASALDDLSDAKVTGTSIWVGQGTTGSLNSANWNTFVGQESGSAVTTGDKNAALGYKALNNVTTGGSNTAIGMSAGERIVTANNNTAIGNQAFMGSYGKSQGNYNVAVGNSAGKYVGNDGGDYNIAIGAQALSGDQTNTSGADYNIGIGYYALKTITTGTRNTAIGKGALDAADTESDNIAIGYDALGGPVAGGEKNIAIGNYAGDAITSADKSVLIGYDAGTATTTAFATVGIGHEALKTNEYGSQNVAVGNEALESINNHFNVAVGSQALQTSTAGIGNTVMGHTAGKNCGANASYNAFFGYRAGDGMDGNYNTAIGTDTMMGGANASGADNTAIGTSALKVLTTGSTNIAIGHDAGDNITTGSNNVVIGAADVSSATGNDQLSISSGDGDVTWITGDSTGKVTMNSVSPAAYNTWAQFSYQRDSIGTSAVTIYTTAAAGATTTEGSYPVPAAGVVKAMSILSTGATLSGTTDQTWRIRKNGSASAGDYEDITFSPADMTNNQTNKYSYTATGLSLSLSANDLLQVKRQSGSVSYGAIKVILYVDFS